MQLHKSGSGLKMQTTFRMEDGLDAVVLHQLLINTTRFLESVGYIRWIERCGDVLPDKVFFGLLRETLEKMNQEKEDDEDATCQTSSENSQAMETNGKTGIGLKLDQTMQDSQYTDSEEWLKFDWITCFGIPEQIKQPTW